MAKGEQACDDHMTSAPPIISFSLWYWHGHGGCPEPDLSAGGLDCPPGQEVGACLRIRQPVLDGAWDLCFVQ